MKKFLILLSVLLLFGTAQANAFEDCVIASDGKLANISIEHNDIIDVFPLITVMNDKNTLIVHPLKEGSTKFSITKNKKEVVIFDVTVSEKETKIKDVDGFDILTIDCPPGSYEYQFDLDEPPEAMELDEPPVLRERRKSE